VGRAVTTQEPMPDATTANPAGAGWGAVNGTGPVEPPVRNADAHGTPEVWSYAREPAPVNGAASEAPVPAVLKAEARTTKRLGAHTKKRQVRTVKRHGAHSMKREARTVKRRAAHVIVGGQRRWPAPLVGAVVALALGLGGGAAYAYFTSHGSGTGSATAGTLQPVTVTAFTGGDTPSTTLLPNGTADVILRVQNLNAFAVTLVSVSGGPGAITVSGGSGCTAGNSGVSFLNQSGLTDAIAGSGSGTTFIDLSGAASMTTASVTGCQGATFNIPVTITVHK
jgi:hypothetical protein